MANNVLTIEAIRFKDVRGKELAYIKFINRKGTEYLINVGEKTLTEVQKLMDEQDVVNKIQVMEPQTGLFNK